MILTGFINSLARVIPDPLFLVVAAGFLGVIMAFLVPLSVEIISKVSAKYNSDVIVRLYKSSFINRIFNYLLLFTIAAMIVTRFFTAESFLLAVHGKIIMWTMLLLSILIIVLVGYLIRRIDKFISGDSMPLDILYKDIARSLGIGAKDDYSRQGTKPINKDKFILATEGIGDILVYQVGRQNNSLILQGLEHLNQSIRFIYEMRSNNSESFDKLVYSEELMIVAEENKNDRQAVSEFCFSDPHKNLAGIASPLNQYKRIYNAALERQNNEVARASLKQMSALSLYFGTQENNFLIVELALRNLIECSQFAINLGDESAELGMHWYVDTLHHEPHQGKGAFQLDYLDIYNKYFMTFVGYIIAESHSNAFRSLVRHLIRIYAIPNYQRGKVWGYHYLLRASDLTKYRSLNEEMGIQRQVRSLAMIETHIETIEQLREWLSLFEKLRRIIQPHLIATQKSEARRLDEIIQSSAVRNFKQRRLLRAAYALGAQCLSRDKYAYIRFLWEQASAHEENMLADRYIVPQTAQQVIDDYLRRSHVLSALGSSDLHPSMDNYFKRYYVLLLARNIKEQDNYTFLITRQIQQTERSIVELIKTLEEMQDSNVFNILDKDKKTVDSIINKGLLQFLQTIKQDALKQLHYNHQKTKISQRKINTYKKQLLKSWGQHNSLRNIFTYYLDSFQNRTAKKLKEGLRGWGIDELVNKSAFLENWDAEKGIGFRHGRTIANNENSFLFDAVAEHCIGQSQKSFEKVLNKMPTPEDIFIIAPQWVLINFLAAQEKFTLGHPYSSEYLSAAAKHGKNKDSYEFNNFAGYYDLNEYNIPVFTTEYSGSGYQMLILNRRRLGTMVQLPIYSVKGVKRKILQQDIFYFEIRDLSTSPKLVNYYLKQELPWLQEKGDTTAQKKYLHELVLIKILENISFEPAPDFIGYRIVIPANLKPARLLDYESSVGLLPA